MLRHVVMFRWNPGTTPADVADVQEGLGGLPAVIPEITRYQFGPDAGINDGNAEFVVVADFADVDGYLAYRDHPLHRALIGERITPRLAERHAVQYIIDDA
ncbi:MAG: Dabb family protein [Acidimicrobiia bacterium]|nr:Dabb family protein [Acidimicrobiia bacterium]